MTPTVTVAICTRDRAAILEETLAHLRATIGEAPDGMVHFDERAPVLASLCRLDGRARGMSHQLHPVANTQHGLRGGKKALKKRLVSSLPDRVRRVDVGRKRRASTVGDEPVHDGGTTRHHEAIEQ